MVWLLAFALEPVDSFVIDVETSGVNLPLSLAVWIFAFTALMKTLMYEMHPKFLTFCSW